MSDTDVMQSYGRCCMVPSFFDDFYQTFLASHPDLPPMFANTDFSKQKSLLKAGINFAIMFGQDQSAFAKNKLEQVGDIHSKERFNIKPSLYPFWVDSLIATIKKHDKKFSNEVENAWRQALQPAIDVLISKYA